MKAIVLSLVCVTNVMATNIAYRDHGTNLPKEVTNLAEAQSYREDVMELLGMEAYEKNEATFYTNSKKGLYLIKKNNRKEPAFKNIIHGAKTVYNWRNGNSFIRALKKYTKNYGCIPKLTSVSHGWASRKENGEVHGLSGSRGLNGIYVNNETRPNFLDRLGTTTIEKHLNEAIESGEVKFCGKCVAQFYACNISTLFANKFAEATKCQTVVATGKASPYFQSTETELERDQTYSAFHYWGSNVGIWEEIGMGQWYRATPITNDQNEVIEVLKENIGDLYIAL